jgi:aquaporin Z
MKKYVGKHISKHVRKNIRKYIAELVGTFVLSLTVSLSLVQGFPVITPIAAGMALGLGVYTMGGISGAHFNPAITLGVASIRKISGKDAVFYIIAQLIGAAAAFQLISRHLKVTPADLVAGESTHILGAEFLGVFVFAFGVAALVHGRVSAGASGLAVGGSLLLGILLAVGAGSNGVLNPAVALAIGSFSMSYLIGPILGAILAMTFYRYLTK